MQDEGGEDIQRHSEERPEAGDRHIREKEDTQENREEKVMAKMKSGVRSPTAHRTKEQASRQWQERSAASKAKNKKWKAARRKVCKGNEAACTGKDVGHKKPLSKGGSNARSNLRIEDRHTNRGHGMSPGGTKKKTTRKR